MSRDTDSLTNGHQRNVFLKDDNRHELRRSKLKSK